MAWSLQDTPGLSLWHKHLHHKVAGHVVSNICVVWCSTSPSQISTTTGVLTLNHHFCPRNLLQTLSLSNFLSWTKHRGRVNQKALKKQECCCCCRVRERQTEILTSLPGTGMVHAPPTPICWKWQHWKDKSRVKTVLLQQKAEWGHHTSLWTLESLSVGKKWLVKTLMWQKHRALCRKVWAANILQQLFHPRLGFNPFNTVIKNKSHQ